MNEDERFGRHAERPKDWDEVEAHPTNITEQLTPQARPIQATLLNSGAVDSPIASPVKLPSKENQTFQQNRFFIAAIALIIALVIMLFVLV